MKLKINIDKKHFFILLGAILLLGILGVVYAIVPNPGHSTDQIDWSQQIASSVDVRDDILAGGRIGIGTTSPAEKLEVDGNIKTLNNGQLLEQGTEVPSMITGSYIGNGAASQDIVVSGINAQRRIKTLIIFGRFGATDVVFIKPDNVAGSTCYRADGGQSSCATFTDTGFSATGIANNVGITNLYIIWTK